MDVTGESRDRLGRVAAWFQATPAELAGLLVLVAGAALASLVLWLQATQRPDELPSGAVAVGEAVAEDWLADGPGDGGAGSGGDGDPEPAAPAEVTVHVSGAVAAPGVVTLPGGARVADAVAAAGGATAEADAERLNLARTLDDGEHVHLPRHGEEAPPQGTSGPAAGGVDADGQVDLNRASAAELETLPGIGPARAEAIVAHRDEHGPFAQPGDLRAVSGIGEVTFQRLADLVVVR